MLPLRPDVQLGVFQLTDPYKWTAAVTLKHRADPAIWMIRRDKKHENTVPLGYWSLFKMFMKI